MAEKDAEAWGNLGSLGSELGLEPLPIYWELQPALHSFPTSAGPHQLAFSAPPHPHPPALPCAV